MGTGCARCSEVEKSKTDSNPLFTPDPGSLGASDEEDEHDDEGSEIVHSSDGEEDPDDYRKDVKKTLMATGENLKRGKTMAMKEAINTAKKIGLEAHVITNAEKQLEEHKKKQRRDAVAEEVNHLFESKLRDEIPQVEKMLKKANDAECEADVIGRLEKHLDMLLISRPLEPDEQDQAREYMKQSCIEFVMKATRGEGRPLQFVSLSSGKKKSAMMQLDAALEHIILSIEDKDEQVVTPVLSVHATAAMKEHTVRSSKGLKELSEEDIACAVAVKYEVDGKPGYWCFVEPTVIRKERLIEAFAMLHEACRLA